MKQIILECKKYLYNWKQILVFYLGCIGIFFIAWQAASFFEKRQAVLEPFEIGIVNQDNREELQMVLMLAQDSETINQIISFREVGEVEAQQLLQSGAIGAYITFPEGFTQSIMYGDNTPAQLYARQDMPLRAQAAKALMNVGSAYISATQSGIYATLDYAVQNGIDRQTVNNEIVMPINIAFIREALARESYFEMLPTTLSNQLTLGEHYILSALSFLAFLHLLCFVPLLKENFSEGIRARYYLAGYSNFRILWSRLVSHLVIQTVLILPLFYFYGWKTFFISLLISCLLLMADALFSNAKDCYIFLFSFSLLALFFSGGIIPLDYFPTWLQTLGKFSPNYWIIYMKNNAMAIIPILLFSLLFLGLGFLANQKGEGR